MVKANVIPGKFLSCLLGIFIGILLTLGGLVGGGFYVYKNVKVGSLLGLLPQETDNWLSDEYAQNTIEGLVKELQSLANGDITLEKSDPNIALRRRYDQRRARQRQSERHRHPRSGRAL